MKTFKQYLIEKPLSSAARIKRSRLMRRMGAKMAMKRKVSMKVKASPVKIKQRAEKKARDIITKKLTKGVPYNALSLTQKMAVDKKLETKRAVIKKVAKKLIPKVKKMEDKRIKDLRTKS